MSGWFGSAAADVGQDEAKGGDKDFRYLPSDEEKETVSWLKEGLEKARNTEFPPELRDYQFTDTTVLRFHRGRKGDREKALHGLIKHVEWRQENHVASISEKDVSEEVQKRKIFVNGKDNNGRPLIWVIASRHDSSDRDLDVMRMFIIWTIEQALAANKIDQDERMVLVFDLSHFGLACMDYEVVKLLVDILQINFPDVLEVAYIVNGPFIFNACWAIIKPWLDPVTVDKVCFCDTDHLYTSLPEGSVVPDFGAAGPLEAAPATSASPPISSATTTPPESAESGRESLAEKMEKLGVGLDQSFDNDNSDDDSDEDSEG